MIPRENTETARVQRQRRMDAKLRAEVSNRMFFRDRVELQLRLRRQVRLESLVDAAHTFHVDRIGRRFGQTERRRFSQELSRVVFALFPNLGIKIAEDALAVG